MNYFNDLIFETVGYFSVNFPMLAQNVTDPNVVGQIQKTWNHFIQTGQVWALLIGLVIGYMFRNLTKYG
ncbi:hypothetical protein ACN23B_19515 [Anabaena sp. FACHB-709]|uniref:Uncharacterized protein n=2 Tax=Nostocaceae TaxID=1162 RepID=A0A1Z4KKM6_ANAVA|nr:MULTISPECIES: hypothetical protein [Nostocaceae]BAY69512.1 hypothetical protein NIES23_23060 [Trichormus variabilis NIES-23]HBW30059.1 hypothetical protein [Nostoc sp. UBA8866]MBD2171021.1 hypothetical protein [Anabaena cylindrica FACHB-318]MBD2262801.1 hypothetical protein [Anabaena sp. FACHB-709]MBD2272401.1 hypothetical protein [Nostoc sp. PCC 7120 = FACHB-418]